MIRIIKQPRQSNSDPIKMQGNLVPDLSQTVDAPLFKDAEVIACTKRSHNVGRMVGQVLGLFPSCYSHITPICQWIPAYEPHS